MTKKIFTIIFLLLTLFLKTSVSQASEVSIPVCISLNKDMYFTLKDSATNGEVSKLQFFLKSKGYSDSEPTGYFGILTVKALRMYQIAKGVPSYGIVGPLTRDRIKKDSCVTGSTQTSTTTASSTASASSTITSTTTNISQAKITSIKVDNASIKAGDTVNIIWTKEGDFSKSDRYYFLYLKNKKDQILGSTSTSATYYSTIFRESYVPYPTISVKIPSDVLTRGSSPIVPGTYYYEIDYTDRNGIPVTSATTEAFSVKASDKANDMIPLISNVVLDKEKIMVTGKNLETIQKVYFTPRSGNSSQVIPLEWSSQTAQSFVSNVHVPVSGDYLLSVQNSYGTSLPYLVNIVVHDTPKPTLSITSPVAGKTYVVSDRLMISITWKSEALDSGIDIVLVDEKGRDGGVLVAGNVANNGSYKIAIPQTGSYKVVLSAHDKKYDIQAESGFFSVIKF